MVSFCLWALFMCFCDCGVWVYFGELLDLRCVFSVLAVASGYVACLWCLVVLLRL